MYGRHFTLKCKNVSAVQRNKINVHKSFIIRFNLGGIITYIYLILEKLRFCFVKGHANTIRFHKH